MGFYISLTVLYATIYKKINELSSEEEYVIPRETESACETECSSSDDEHSDESLIDGDIFNTLVILRSI